MIAKELWFTLKVQLTLILVQNLVKLRLTLSFAEQINGLVSI